MFHLSKEATNKDQTLKTQMLVTFEDGASKGSEKIWMESAVFGDQRSELTIPKANFPENTLCYDHQGTFSLIKGGDKTLYLEFVVLGQLIPAANLDPGINLDTYVYNENKVLMYPPVYNKSRGMYGGLTKRLGYITLRGDSKERFYTYGYSKEKSTLLYCYMKTPVSNIFHCTAFKKHPLLFDKNKNKSKFSKCSFTSLQLLIEKRTFYNGKITYICIQLMLPMMI